MIIICVLLSSPSQGFAWVATCTRMNCYGNPLWGDKSEYVNPYIPTQIQEEYWIDHMQNHQADSPLYVWPDVWSTDLHLFIKNMVIHDIECPYWDLMLLNKTKQTYGRKQVHFYQPLSPVTTSFICCLLHQISLFPVGLLYTFMVGPMCDVPPNILTLLTDHAPALMVHCLIIKKSYPRVAYLLLTFLMTDRPVALMIVS